MTERSDPTAFEHVTAAWLSRRPLPTADPDGDKERRGHVLVVAGSPEMPGAAVLGSIAALRAGAGKLSLFTARSVAPFVAIAVPEARVVAGNRTPAGGLRVGTLERLIDEDPYAFDALLVGPGMQSDKACGKLLHAVAQRLSDAVTVIDALAIKSISRAATRRAPQLITPHAGELAALTGSVKERIVADPFSAAADAARSLRVSVLLKGPVSVFASPQGTCWQHRSSRPGLGTSGSGDVLAGIIAGLIARGADVPTAAAWGVAIHDCCGARLAAGMGELGYLARDLVYEIPFAAYDLQVRCSQIVPESTLKRQVLRRSRQPAATEGL